MRRWSCHTSNRGALFVLLMGFCSILAADSGVAQSRGENEHGIGCGWEVNNDRVTEIVVEVFSDPESSASHILGYGPAEVSGALQHITAYFTALDLETIKPLTLKAWANCHPIGGPMACEQLMTSGSEQSGELFVYAINAWKGGHENYVLLQLFDDEGQLLAQGTSSFRLEAITNKTEGLIDSLAAAQVQRVVDASGNGETCARRLLQMDSACGEGASVDTLRAYSSVDALEWDEFICSQPRAPLRVYHVSMVQWTRGLLHLWLPTEALQLVGAEGYEAGKLWPDDGKQVGMLRLVAGRLPSSSACHPLHSWQEEKTTVALLPVGVTAGSIEHLGHFFLDYLANVYRMQEGYLSRSGRKRQDVEWMCLVDDMRPSLDDLPPRKFYPLLEAVCRQPWRSLGELPEKTCLTEVVIAFGGLETIRSREAWAVPATVHTELCRLHVVGLQQRVLESVQLSPRVLQRGEGMLVYLSRQDTGWRRLLNEEALVRDWNEAHTSSRNLQIRAVHLHAMPIREQLQLLQDTRVMIGVNGGQINALFFLPQGSTHAAIFAMRWTDQNFGYVYHSWLKHRGVRYLQYDCTKGGTTNLDWLSQARYSDDWRGSMRAIRDADIRMPPSEFRAFITEAVHGDEAGPFSSSDDPSELHKVLVNFEDQSRARA